MDLGVSRSNREGGTTFSWPDALPARALDSIAWSMQLIVGTIRLPAEKSVRSASAMRMMADASLAWPQPGVGDRDLRVSEVGEPRST